jgi:hypothetical protein
MSTTGPITCTTLPMFSDMNSRPPCIPYFCASAPPTISDIS